MSVCLLHSRLECLVAANTNPSVCIRLPVPIHWPLVRCTDSRVDGMSTGHSGLLSVGCARNHHRMHWFSVDWAPVDEEGDCPSCPSSCGYNIIFDECTSNALHKKQMRRNCSQWTIIAFAFYLLPRREDANLEYTASQSQSLLQNAVTIIIIVIIRLHGNCCCSSTGLSWLPKPIKSVLDLQFAPTRHANSSCFVFSSIWYPYVAICLSFLINCCECIIGF